MLTLGAIWRLAIPYFRSEDRLRGGLLLASVVAIELAVVGITVLINKWNNQFFNSLQDRNWNVFVYQLGYFCVLAGVFIILRVYQLYLNQWLQIRWRRWLTGYYLGRWLNGVNHYRMQLLGDPADNPDQRIADDVRLFIDRTLRIGLGFLNSVVTLLSFLLILWSLSASAPLPIIGQIPGYLVWAALIYSSVGTGFTHLIGRKLIALLFNQQRYEADFRFNLVRVRENSEQIALLGGEPAETERLLGRFSAIMSNWMSIMSRQKKLTFFTASFDQASVVFPYVMVAPAYFAGVVQLGGLMQTASAFGSVQQSLSFFVLTYADLAEWRAIIERLSGFERSIETARRAAASPKAIEIVPRPQQKALAIEDLAVRLPAGSPAVAVEDMTIAAGDHVLVTGPSGAGKSTLFRAIAGIWPFGAGRVVVPAGARLMMLPQRPYFPVASLADAISYPAKRGTFDDQAVAEVLTAVGLGGLRDRLTEEAHWNATLSVGEQQRLGIARAILHKPDFLFLDEATGALDEPAEAELYRLLRHTLTDTTLISIGHRSTLHAFHERSLKLERDGDHYQLRERKLETAAE
jgi:putative ATP-binding cassette transporter